MSWWEEIWGREVQPPPKVHMFTPLPLTNSCLGQARQEKSSTGYISVESRPFPVNFDSWGKKAYAIQTSWKFQYILKDACYQWSVTRSILTVTYITAGWNAHDKMLMKCLSSELFPLKSEKSSTCFLPGRLSRLTFHCRAKETKDLRGMAMSLDLRRKGKRIWRQVASVCQETSVCKTTNNGNTSASNTTMCAGSQQWEWGIRVWVRKNRRWQNPCMPWWKQTHGFWLDSRKGKTRGNRSLVAFTRNTAYQSCLLPSSTGAT